MSAPMTPEPGDEPLIVRRFDIAMEPAPEEEQVLTIGCIAADGRPVALLLNLDDRPKVAGWLALEPGTSMHTTLTEAYLDAWEEQRENVRLRLALESARRGRRELRARVAELEAQQAAVLALHRKHADSDHCFADDETWPCNTRAALDPVVSPRDLRPGAEAARRMLRAKDEVAGPEEASPWEQAVAGLNALVDADVVFHVEPDGHISAPFSDEHIEWDLRARRWVLTHDDEHDGGSDV
ncbi:hypothetical protein [Nocardia sp. NPDC051981]|uniref:hypothetical protein n=1 Tax=Nocardia sp. NPDC051981 TaxID=3155417 RepID=UPI00341D1D3E